MNNRQLFPAFTLQLITFSNLECISYIFWEVKILTVEICFWFCHRMDKWALHTLSWLCYSNKTKNPTKDAIDTTENYANCKYANCKSFRGKLVILGHFGNDQNVSLELISVHQTIKGDPNDGLDKLKPNRSYLNHILTWYSKLSHLPNKIPIITQNCHARWCLLVYC